MKILRVSIDVTKIDKSRLYKGDKGTYLNAKVVLRDEKDTYGNDGFIAEQVSKEEREAGKDGTILGNVKIVFESDPKPKVEAKQETLNNDIPF